MIKPHIHSLIPKHLESFLLKAMCQFGPQWLWCFPPISSLKWNLCFPRVYFKCYLLGVRRELLWCWACLFSTKPHIVKMWFFITSFLLKMNALAFWLTSPSHGPKFNEAKSIHISKVFSKSPIMTMCMQFASGINFTTSWHNHHDILTFQ